MSDHRPPLLARARRIVFPAHVLSAPSRQRLPAWLIVQQRDHRVAERRHDHLLARLEWYGDTTASLIEGFSQISYVRHDGDSSGRHTLEHAQRATLRVRCQ